MTSLRASFSFASIDAENVTTKGGEFSWLSMPNTVLGGNEGEPQIPVINQLIAVPFGAQPTITVTSYSSTDYQLSDLGINTLIPRQRPVRKDQNPDDVPFVMNQAAYQTRGMRSEPMATVSVEGTMRGVQLGTMTIEPVSYDPVSNTIRVFNDINVEVSFDGADAQATQDMLLKTYSPAFEPVYAQLFNDRAITDAYTDHPDLYHTPVRMLVICYSGFQGNEALNSWLQWKLQKGYYVDIFYTTETGTTSSAIASFIKTKYNASVSEGNAYTYLIVIGDTGQVPQYMSKTIDSDIGSCASDLGYASVNFSSSTSNYFPDMYYSRMSVENTTHLTNYINKVLTYEKFQMTDGGNYLNNVILVGGWDSNWTPKVAKPTINYGSNYYFKSSNTTYGGFENGTIEATVSTSSTAGYAGSATGTSTTMGNGVYTSINSGVGFLNYTAHGDKQEWYQPKMTAAQVANLTNSGKYFFGVGNCCLTGNFNNTTTTYSPGSAIGTNACFAETMIRVPNAGAVAYIGCSPYSYWYEDFYWAVGAHSYSQGNYPTQSASSTGVYDAMFIDGNWNSASALLYLGNLAVQQAVTNNNTNSSVTDGNCNNSAHYYFQFYHTFGDGSVMPYVTKPEVNTVTIPSTVNAGSTSVTINALAGSYVAVTDNSTTIYGVAEANSNGVATVNFDKDIPDNGTLHVVVTRQQYQPYFGTIEILSGEEYTISTNVNPANAGTVTGAGTYYENTECTLEATANHGYAFQKWNDNNTDNPRTITVTGNATYTANFRQLEEHHTTFNPQQEHGTISVNTPSGQLFAGDIVTLTATPDAGYCLDEWIVETVSKARIPVVNNQFEMPDSDVTISATFKSGYTITVATVANGTITASTTSAMNGDAITLTATPNTGCEFSTWYVYKTGDPNTVVTVVNNSFTMPAYDVTVSAVFATTSTGDVTIGSGTATDNGQYLPTYNYWNYSLTQQIYTADEVGDAGTITKIAFYVSSNAATRNIDIYMRPTTKTSFSSNTDWESMGDIYKVYSGSHTFSTGWNTITLATPFEYDGVKNINLCVVDNTGSCVSSSSNAMKCYTYSSSSNRSMYVYNDDNAYSVGTSGQITSYSARGRVAYNNQLKLTKVLKNNESLTVSPEAINDFSYLMGMGPSNVETVTIVGSDLSNDITVTAPTDFEISTSATGTYGQTVTIPRATSGRGDRTVTEWGFEGSFDNWTTIEADGDTYNWVLGSAVSGIYLEEGSNFSEGHDSSTDMLVSGSYSNVAGELTPDNWLVSPQVTLGGTFTMFAGSSDASWCQEHFGIYVSTTSNTNTSSFTLLNEWTLADADWNEYSVDLSAYAGQSGYIAVRHFNCTNMFLLLVDDFKLDTEASYTPDLPVVLTPATVYVRMKADLNIGDYSGNMTVASGTLNKTVALSGIVEPNGGEQYDIMVVASPTEGGTVTGAGTYYEQSRVTLTATPATHYTFVGWQLNGTTVSTSASYQIIVTGDATYTAVFAPMTAHNIAITQPTGAAITSDLATAYAGDVVTVTYTVESGYFFVEWSVVDAYGLPVEVTANGQSGQFTMPDSDVTVTATFTTGYTVTLNQTANGTISADQTTGLQPGDHVTLTATPDAGCVFLAWYAYRTGNPRDVVDVIANTTIIMPASDVTVQAIFVTEEEHEASLGSGTTTHNYIPTYTRAQYSLSQQIYLASELDNQNGRITKIAYRANRAATRNLDIYIRHTDNTSFSSSTDWTTMGPSFKVFSGSVDFSGSDWTTITLDTPFEYDGESNIIICVVDNTGSTTNQNTGFYRYNGTSRALYAYGSSEYSNVNYSNITDYTGTRINYVNRINITIMVPGSAESLTLSPGEMADFSYVENHGPSHTDKLDIIGVDLQNNITLTAPTNFEISLTENGTYASSLTIPRETGSKGNRNITTWNFDDGLGSWTTVDADGDGNNWYSNTNSGQTHNESAGAVTSASYSGGALTPDNWLISPQVELGGTFSMWACPQDAAWPQEHFGIFVSTTDANPSSFTMLNEWTCQAGVWKQYSVDLRLYAGQTGYIAVRHFDCTDLFRLNVDDFELDTEASITIEMPVTITAETVYVRMKDNLSAGTYTGTLTGAEGSFNGSVSLSGEVIAEYDITVAANPAVGGNVRGTGAYAAGTEISVIAAANPHFNFINWTENGVEVSTNAEYEFTVSADRDLVANFVLETFQITAEANPTEGGTITGADTYSYGAEATLTATPAEGYRFVNWTENDVEVSTSATYSFTVEADRDLVANFVQNSYELEIEAYNNDGDGWYLIASPLAEAVNATAVTNLTNETFDLYRFNQSAVNKEWENWKQQGSDHYQFQIEPGKGYLYANSNDVTLSFVGLPTTETEVSFDLDYDENALAGVRGYNLVGNPFAQTATIDKDFFRMNETHTDFVATQAGEVGIMEGVIVVANGNTNDDKVTFTTATREAKSNVPAQSITLTLTADNGMTVDRAIVRFNKDSQLPKYMLNSDNPNIYIPKDNRAYAIAKAEMQGETPVNFRADKNGTYTLYVNTQNIEMAYLHLIDNLTGADVDLLKTTSYSFEASTTDYASRFRLVYNADANADNGFSAFVSNGQIVLTGVDANATVQVIDALGRIIVSRSHDVHSISTTGMVPGVYVLRVINGSDANTQKIVIE